MTREIVLTHKILPKASANSNLIAFIIYMNSSVT